MCLRAPSSFQDHFASLSDPRSFHAPNLRHELIDILVMAVCAVICGAEGWEDIEEYAQAQAEWFAELYAAYYSQKLKDSHPFVPELKKLES